MSAPSEGVADVASLSFEQARDELVRVVAELEQGAPTLEHSLALWERGEALAARCEEWLLGAKRRLEAARSAPATVSNVAIAHPVRSFPAAQCTRTPPDPSATVRRIWATAR